MNFFNNIIWSFLPKKVYGLVGPPGSGKSFRASLIAEKYNIDFIIDDGLLLKGQKILAGQSAKRESYYISAVKRAIFNDKGHAEEIRKKLTEEKYTSILILGTSVDMVEKIVDTLHLPKIQKIIKIEDIATKEEIRKAQSDRLKYGKHVIPIPLIEVKKKYPNLVLHAIHMLVDEPKGIFFKKKKKKMIEKTIVRPNFGNNGTISITDTALIQMVSHCIDEITKDIKLSKLLIIEESDGFSLKLDVNATYMGSETSSILQKIQSSVGNSIENFTGIKIFKIDIEVVKTKKKNITPKTPTPTL